MSRFTKREIDRSLSPEELEKLSEAELTKLTFKRDCKNLAIFLPQVFIFYFIAGHFNLFGKVVGWIGVVMFGVFALQGLFNLVLTLLSLLGTPFF